MNIALFNKKYWVRRFSEPKNVRGYLTSGREDFVASLHIHPMGSDAMLALPEGERKMKHLEGHGTVELRPASEKTGIKGDLLFYMGDWYECTAAQPWDHTLLSHLNYQFCLVPKDGARGTDIEDPPAEDPSKADRAEGATAPITNFPIASANTAGVIRLGENSGLVIDEEGYLSLDKTSASSPDGGEGA